MNPRLLDNADRQIDIGHADIDLHMTMRTIYIHIAMNLRWVDLDNIQCTCIY